MMGARTFGCGPLWVATAFLNKRRLSLNTLRARRRLVTALFAALAVPAAQPVAVQAQEVDRAALQSLDAYVTRAVRDWNLPGLAIAVVAGDSVVFAKGYGLREVGKPDLVDTGTRFAIGSTTKAFVATALGILVDEGKIEWDAPVITYLPWFRVSDPYITRELTVRDLLIHRAGFPNIDQIWTNPGFSSDEIVRRIAPLETVYSFRSGFIYQNVMYAVAGAVIEAASGMPWDAFVRARITQPLGMRATQETLAALEGQPNVAAPHTNAGGTIRLTRNRSVDAVGPAGSMWSSVDDMATWLRFNLNGGQLDGRRLVSEATHAEILSPHVVAPKSMYPAMQIVRPRFFTYGLGWFLHDYRGEAVAMHTGSINGMNALIGMLPDRGVGLYVLANTGGAELRHALMYHVFDLFIGGSTRDWSAELLALYAAQRGQGGGQVAQSALHPTPPSLPLERYTGEYRDPIFGTITVTLRDGALYLVSELDRRGRLAHRDFDAFEAAWEDEPGSTAAVVFQPDGAGGVRGVRVFGRLFAR
jgi:CubicO group peptidase (beta-lactamase class C family)